MTSIRLVQPQDISAINQLRVDAYGSATWFDMDAPEKLHLAADPPATRVLVAADGPNILGTVGIALSFTRAQLEHATGADLEGRELLFPAATVIRLATSGQARGQCLNHVFRLHMLKAARDQGIACFCSSQAAGTPNIAAMQELGYHYESVASDRQSTVAVADGALLLNWLHASQFDAVIAKLERYLLDRQAPQLRWAGPALDLR